MVNLKLYSIAALVAGRISRSGRRLLKALWYSFSEFFRGRYHHRAAALSFTSIFALVPLVAIFLFVLNLSGFLIEYRDKVQDLVLRHFAPESRDAVARFIAELVEKLRDYSTSSGLVGFVTFVAVGILLLLAIEGVFNDIWKVRKSRPLMKRIFAFWFVLCFIPISLAASAYIESRVERSDILNTYVSQGSITGFIYSWFIPLGFTYLSFFILYFYLPNTRVCIPYGLAGALISGSLWEFAKWGFKVYLSQTVSYYQLFGSAGAVPIFLVWIYLSWLIVLFGAVLSYVLQHINFIEINRSSKVQAASIHPEYLGSLIMCEMASRFAKGKSHASTEEMALKFGVPPQQVSNVMASLEETKLIVRISETEAFVLARSPETIRLTEIFGALGIREHILLDRFKPEMEAAVAKLEETREKSRRLCEQITLQDLLSKPAGGTVRKKLRGNNSSKIV